MNVIGLYDEFGPSYHRIYVPLHTMKGLNKCLITNHLTEARIEAGCDVIYVNRVFPANELKQVLEWRKKYGFKIVVDMDDHFKLDASHIAYDHYKKHNLSNLILNCIIEADAITCTHERLGHDLEAYNRNVWVIPNAIPKWGQFDIQRTYSDKVRLFWAGSITHEHDIAILRNPMKRLAGSNLKNKIFTVLGGYHKDEPIWQRMVHCFTAGLRIPGNIQEGRKVQDYYSMYQYADICLIPLVKSTFNSNKSNLKILEAANLGIPVIVSHVDPYLGFPTDLVNYVYWQSDWFYHIKKLVENPEWRIEQGLRLQEYCRKNYDYDYINFHRYKLFESLCEKQKK